jgi:hypothetical protein
VHIRAFVSSDDPARFPNERTPPAFLIEQGSHTHAAAFDQERYWQRRTSLWMIAPPPHTHTHVDAHIHTCIHAYLRTDLKKERRLQARRPGRAIDLGRISFERTEGGQQLLCWGSEGVHVLG